MKRLIFVALWLLVSGFTPRDTSDLTEVQALVNKGLCELKLDVNVLVRPIRPEVVKNARSRGAIIKAHVYPLGGGYIIEVADLGDFEVKRVIAHELIHIHQFETRQLVAVTWGVSVIWEDNYYKVAEIPYDDRPWEVDAKERAELLKRKL